MKFGWLRTIEIVFFKKHSENESGRLNLKLLFLKKALSGKSKWSAA